MNTPSLLVRANELRTEMRGILSAAGDNDLTADQEAALDALKASLTKTEARAARQAELDEADRRAAGTPAGETRTLGAPLVRIFGHDTAAPAGFDGITLRAQTGERVPVLEARHSLSSFVPRTESRAAELGLGGFLRVLVNGAQTDLERRAMGEASLGAGGALVPTPLSAELIDLMRARAVAFQAGARTIPMSSQTLKFARVISDPVGGWRAEAASIATDAPTFDQVTLTAKSYALLVKVSRELLQDGQNTDAQIRNVIANAAALALDQAILGGSGSSNQPLGIKGTSGIQSVSMGTNGVALLNWAKVLDAVYALEAANAGTITAMVMHPRTAREIYGFLDADSQPLQQPPRLVGIPMLTTTSMSIAETQGSSSVASSILLGDFREVFVGMREAMSISVLNEKYSDTGEVGFVVHLRADVAVARPAALARIAGVL